MAQAFLKRTPYAKRLRDSEASRAALRGGGGEYPLFRVGCVVAIRILNFGWRCSEWYMFRPYEDCRGVVVIDPSPKP